MYYSLVCYLPFESIDKTKKVYYKLFKERYKEDEMEGSSTTLINMLVV